MSKPRRLKYRKLVKRLKKHGIRIIEERGKGSERMLYEDKTRLNFPIKCHGENQEYSISFLKAIQRKFSISDQDMYG